MSDFHSFLRSQIDSGGFPTEDVLVSFLPLIRQVIVTHDYGEVAPLEGLNSLKVANRQIWFSESDQLPLRRQLRTVKKLLNPASAGVDVTGRSQVTFDVDDGDEHWQDSHVTDSSEGAAATPSWLPGYVCWEHTVGHHDPVTDVFSLGLILASLACGLDLADPADLERFVTHRNNLFRINEALHPVIARTIVVMTELDRHQRPPDLRALLATLENYRDQEVDFETDLASTSALSAATFTDKRQVVLSKLRERLFEINRRNRLLHFRTTLQTINLTQASIPLSFDVSTIRQEQVLSWNNAFRDDVLKQKPVLLNKFLNFREAAYLPATLDRLRAEARRDENDFGFAQLRLIVAFLRWADLKVSPPERYESPLLLLPVKLDVKKGIHDRYSLQAMDGEAEVNPVVRHLFKQLYDIELPETVELSAESLDTFCENFRNTIRANDASVELRRIDKARIELIHAKAKRRLDQYRRRTRLAGRGIRHFMDLDYSYDSVNYHPLGVRIFEHMISPTKLQLESVIDQSSPKAAKAKSVANNTTAPSSEAEAGTEAAEVEAEGEFYRLLDEVDDNPLNWEIDFCSVTLANLKYRRMSLAQDYNRLIVENTANAAFEATFALGALDDNVSDEALIADRSCAEPTTNAVPLTERFHIVPCDPTQATATAKARTGGSYIIQGPPGTGKSQTIANLIADFVIRGKRILFVCEKRAAVDVVYHRLKQQGLQDLCCLIHDSQADKKQFVMDLKRTYDDFLAEAEQPRDQHRGRRDEVVDHVQTALQPIDEFNTSMTSAPDHIGLPVRTLLNRLIELKPRVRDLLPHDWERVPTYAAFEAHRQQLADFETRLQRIEPSGMLANHPLRLISAAVVDAERPIELVTECLVEALHQLQHICDEVARLELPSETTSSFNQFSESIQFAEDTAFLTERDLLQLLDTKSNRAQKLQRRVRKLEKCDALIAKHIATNQHWRQKLSPEDTRTALEQAKRLEGGLLSALKPKWWRLRKTLDRAYDFSHHEIKPSWVSVLQKLEDEHEAKADRYRVAQEVSDEFGIHLDLDRFLQSLQSVKERLKTESGPIKTLARYARASKDGATTLFALAELREPLNDFTQTADRFLDAYQYCSPGELSASVEQLNAVIGQLPDCLHCLATLQPLPRELTDALRTLPLTTQQLEAAAAEHSLNETYRAAPDVARFDGDTRSSLLQQLMTKTDQWLIENAQAVRESVRQQFCDNVVISTTPAAQLTPDQKEFRKQYARGRRELEHEFGKSMRYKSIRELAGGDSGLVIRDLKPVWLMSPLSVSDTLPLSAEHFDAVIFDEASQITLEDAVPALFRADQAIVVGDEMQLPPTSFFGSRRADDDELEFEEDGELVSYDLNSSSLLNHGSKNLPSTMLGWHYRSRSESLISFSNHAFYGGRLLTVPEESLPQPELPELCVERPTQGSEFAEAVIDRPVSFHFMEKGVYEKRRNTFEAEYIAQLVRSLLLQECGYSIGIVAFSEAQQSEIERALRSLAEDDSDFGEAFEAELEREDDGQFAGLLIRNLENIQGDERDIIIMSVCYGPDQDGRTRMNFGPINMAGGEKRLNVAFSRAKQFMTLVSSMRSTAITNEYNDGANCLKRYLRYAEACSVGQAEAMATVLRSLSGYGPGSGDRTTSPDPVTNDIADELRGLGFTIDFDVGQSHFRVNLAVRREGDREYRLGILVDTDQWYQQLDLLERELLKPRLLAAFGWTVEVVLAKDWYHDKVCCVTRLHEALKR
ncbi:AAA domain-containing protein [Fuerstiella marisgermanici]|uniref:Putative DNA helicase n=1 Tax=Fuerstiella marisgermanici TaxID=1891926 RepID=A0A1P8WE26_9PLAN|nr:AAA domain-containing protein [Fuerstiella marisgermanici]APZ92304.1 putative DNA helicase [Fuerstiella marisgermanici]